MTDTPTNEPAEPTENVARASAREASAAGQSRAPIEVPFPDDATATRRVFRHPVLVVVAILVGIGVAVLSGNNIETNPFRLKPKQVTYGYAAQQLVVDSSRSILSNSRKDIGPLASRAQVFAALMTSDPVREQIAERMKVPSESIALITKNPGATNGDTTDAQDQLQAITTANTDYQVTFTAETSGTGNNSGLPIVSLAATASTRAKAEAVANAAGAVGRAFFDRRARNRKVSSISAVRLTPIGVAQGVTVQSGVKRATSFVTGLAAFFVVIGLIIFLDRGLDANRARRANAAANRPASE